MELGVNCRIMFKCRVRSLGGQRVLGAESIHGHSGDCLKCNYELRLAERDIFR